MTFPLLHTICFGLKKILSPTAIILLLYDIILRNSLNEKSTICRACFLELVGNCAFSVNCFNREYCWL